MENSVRDTFAPALISKGYSLNDTDENHLREALDILKKQKDDKIVYAYYVDETADAMIGEEASIALCPLLPHRKSESGICDSKRRFQPLDRFLVHSKVLH